MRHLVSAFAGLCLLAPVALAAESMNFTVKGANPDGSGAYEGTATVTQVGKDVYQVTQTIAGKTTGGIGVGNPGSSYVAIVLMDEAQNGSIMLLKIGSDESAQGWWTAPGQTAAGTETWTPVK